MFASHQVYDIFITQLGNTAKLDTVLLYANLYFQLCLSISDFSKLIARCLLVVSYLHLHSDDEVDLLNE